MAWRLDPWGAWTDAQSGSWRLRPYVGVVTEGGTAGAITISVTDTVSGSEADLASAVRNVIRADSVEGAESVNSILYLNILLADVVQSTETLSHTLLSSIIQMVDEGVQGSELLVRILGFVKNVNELIEYTELTGVNRILSNIWGEVIEGQESSVSSLLLLRSWDDTAGIQDIQFLIRNLRQINGDTLDVINTFTDSIQLNRLLSELLDVPENTLGSISRLISYIASEIVNLSEQDLYVLLQLIVTVITDELQLQENISWSEFINSVLSEGINLSEFSTAILTLVRVVWENIQEIESLLSRVITGIIVITETLNGNEQWTNVKGIIRTLVENISISEIWKVTAAILTLLIGAVIVRAALQGKVKVNKDAS